MQSDIDKRLAEIEAKWPSHLASRQITPGIGEDLRWAIENIRALAAKLAEAQAQCKRRDIALQSLTPMGSEYVNDPDRCVAYVKHQKQSSHELIIKTIKERKALEAKLAAAEAEVGRLKRGRCIDCECSLASARDKAGKGASAMTPSAPAPEEKPHGR